MEKDAFEMTDREVLNVDILKETISSNNNVSNLEEYFKGEKKKLLAKLAKDIKLSKIKEGIVYGILTLICASLGLTIHGFISTEAVINSFFSFIAAGALGGSIVYLGLSPYFKKQRANINKEFERNFAFVSEQEKSCQNIRNNNGKIVSISNELTKTSEVVPTKNFDFSDLLIVGTNEELCNFYNVEPNTKEAGNLFLIIDTLKCAEDDAKSFYYEQLMKIYEENHASKRTLTRN